jgi:c-di-AMP phosphodiesterase-like protein
MQQKFPQAEPPSKPTIMKDVGLSIILVLITIIGIIIASIILGSTHVIGFDMLVFILVGIMLVITVFFTWYSMRTRQKLTEQYHRNIVDMKRNLDAFKNEIMQIRLEESRQWQQWAGSFTQASYREYLKHSEELKNQCMEAIFIAENKMNSNIENTKYTFASSVQSLQFAVDSYRQHLARAMKQMDALEEHIKKELQPENKESRDGR